MRSTTPPRDFVKDLANAAAAACAMPSCSNTAGQVLELTNIVEF
jgi:hypothetical protein